MRRLARAALAAALFFTSLPALADPTPQDISQARDLGAQAQAASEAGNFAESERLWSAASNLYPAAPTLTLGLARAQVKQGKYVIARENYNKIIREQSSNPNASPAFKEALAAAQAEIEAATAKIAHVTITIEGGATNAQVLIDNDAVNAAGLGVPRPIDPGQHTVKATAEGYAPAETTFQVAEAGNAEARLTMTKDASAKPVGPTGPVVNEPPKTVTTKRDHTLAIVAFGVGGAGLVFGGITGAMAMGKHGDLDKQCASGKCSPALQSDVDSFHTMATLSTVGFIVGGVGVAAGAVLWFAGPKKEVKTGRGLEWSPYFAGNGGGVAGRF
ncbi:MAG: hypothetical protein U0270_07750 [Labilithrix sp.]